MTTDEALEALTRAWARTNEARRAVRHWRARAEQAERDAKRQVSFVSAADALAEVASALPDVVKTKELRAALSRYRKERI